MTKGRHFRLVKNGRAIFTYYVRAWDAADGVPQIIRTNFATGDSVIEESEDGKVWWPWLFGPKPSPA